MTTPSTPQPEPGWYPDLFNPRQQRCRREFGNWDGGRSTNMTATLVVP